jgi:membrane-associated phospholipid phosphatase
MNPPNAGQPGPDMPGIMGPPVGQGLPGDIAAAQQGTPVPQEGPPMIVESPEATTRLGAMFEIARTNVWSDEVNYFSVPSLGQLLAVTGAAAVMANTNFDRKTRDWYQDHVRSSSTDNLAKFWKPLGDGTIIIPAVATMAVVGECLDEYPVMDTVGEFGTRSLRGYLVGAPPMLLMQELTGGGRPSEGSESSDWHPFLHPNGASGHAFMSAVPFITAAKMSDNPFAKSLFYACSFMTGWSRVNDDMHYTSQALLGWSMAYLACEAVDDTEEAKHQHFKVEPMVTPEMTGVGFTYQR